MKIVIFSFFMSLNVYAQQVQSQTSKPVIQSFEEDLKFQACSYPGKEALVQFTCLQKKDQPLAECRVAINRVVSENINVKKVSSGYLLESKERKLEIKLSKASAILKLNEKEICHGERLWRLPSTFSQEVEAICKNQPTPTCKTCLDGWSVEEYVDKRDSSLYAQRKVAICKPCENSFKLDTGEGLQMVSCQELYQSLENKNKGCGDCLDKRIRAGG